MTKNFKPQPRDIPFAQMLVGESILIKPPIRLESARMVCFRLSKTTGRKFVFRNSDGGYRFWRVA